MIISLDQILIVLSHEPEKIVDASAEIAIDSTESECPSRTLTHSPVAVYQILIILSFEQENIVEATAEIDIEGEKSKFPD